MNCWFDFFKSSCGINRKHQFEKLHFEEVWGSNENITVLKLHRKTDGFYEIWVVDHGNLCVEVWRIWIDLNKFWIWHNRIKNERRRENLANSENSVCGQWMRGSQIVYKLYLQDFSKTRFWKVWVKHNAHAENFGSFWIWTHSNIFRFLNFVW